MSAPESRTDCSDLLGLPEAEVTMRLGPPDARIAVGADVWLIHETSAGRLRLRCSRAESGADFRVASWTFGFRTGHGTLRAAAEAVGLWPDAAPDVAAASMDVPLARRALTRPDGPVHSLTATARGGRFTHVSVFDEPPDWL